MMAHWFWVSKSPPAVRLCEWMWLLHVQEMRKGNPMANSCSTGWRSKPANKQVRFTDSVTVVTDPKFEFPLFLDWTTQSFPHVRFNQLRVWTKPTFWNAPLAFHGWNNKQLLHVIAIIEARNKTEKNYSKRHKSPLSSKAVCLSEWIVLKIKKYLKLICDFWNSGTENLILLY